MTRDEILEAVEMIDPEISKIEARIVELIQNDEVTDMNKVAALALRGAALHNKQAGMLAIYERS